MRIRFTFFLSLSFVHALDACSNDDERIAELAGLNNLIATECADVAQKCDADNNVGAVVRRLCCKTCSPDDENNDEDSSIPASSILPPAGDEPLQLFLLGGQSECSGSATASTLEADADTYPELQGIIDGLWFAGYNGTERGSSFHIAPMQASVGRKWFGPEVSFGERIRAITGLPTMMVKYCVGGTNVGVHWNPDTPENRWDREADDGTAQWLENNADLFVQSPKLKMHLFVNMIYTIRRTEEALLEGDIPFDWAGIVWVQGNADRDENDPLLWKTFGENTARVWDGFRDELGSAVPIVDQGAATKNQLISGKKYATQIVKGCRAINVEAGTIANDDTTTDCITSVINPCFDAPNIHRNLDVYDFYGWDPTFPSELKPVGASDKSFVWWKNFETNLHSGYEGMILKGRMLANHFLLEFTDHNLGTFADDDIAIQFPSSRCDDGVLPSEDNLCWIDYRDDSLMVELCTLSDDENNVGDDDFSAACKNLISSTAYMLLLFSAAAMINLIVYY